MKNSLLKKLLLGTATCAVAFGVAAGVGVEKSYANETNNPNPTLYAQESLSNISDDDFQADEDLFKHISNYHAENRCENHGDVWIVTGGGTNTVTKILPNNQSFSFTYHIRGWFGNNTSDWCRHAHVQFFYNKNSKELCVLTFGNKQNDEYRTYSYPVIASGACTYTIWENTLEFGDKETCIAEEATKLIIDPTVTSFGRISQQCLEKVTVIDTAGQDYTHCAYTASTDDYKFSGSSFRHLGRDSRINMLFLNGFTDLQGQTLGKKLENWAPGSHVTIKGVDYDD